MENDQLDAIKNESNGDSLRRNEYQPDPRHGNTKLSRGHNFSESENVPPSELAAARDRMKAAKPQNSAAPAWRPDIGAEICGRLTAIETGRTKQSDSERVAIIQTDTGPVAVWLFYTVLADEWDKLSPKPGELVLIERLDDGIAKSHGGAFRRYSVAVDRPTKPLPDSRQTDWVLAEGGAL